jgi:hypothetical protein
MNCAASKAKCDDQKPCGRCRTKNLDCQTTTKRPSGYEASDGALFFPPLPLPPAASLNSDASFLACSNCV